MDTGAAVVMGAVALVCGAIVVLLVRGLARDAPRREADLAQRWAAALARSSDGSGARLVYVQSRYQNVRRGSKAVVYWQPSGLRQDAWFEGWAVPVGVYLVVQGSIGWGPQNRNPKVLYVNRRGVLDVIPGDAPDAWRRHRERAKGDLS